MLEQIGYNGEEVSAISPGEAGGFTYFIDFEPNPERLLKIQSVYGFRMLADTTNTCFTVHCYDGGGEYVGTGLLWDNGGYGPNDVEKVLDLRLNAIFNGEVAGRA
jgi:hypothetical protein